ncbi:16S rRNA (uracil(1498)-N(3))-methyltransferase [Mediterraneibacter agrestimuris]|uniref:16S rRNA (uracil(1498)-N(3))-methyltransferase n=1 Tax=Mediterraneibacter agrestimuris TaxID=2941333 RepID=UPI00203E076E|nr:16S rRNA (uracil(1498)-N(3))-methyltransferase [Mediterraneibacter agrestimuris]
MHHFFAEPSQIADGKVMITGSDVNHMKNVLRMKPGERAEISDGNGLRYLCVLEEFTDAGVSLCIEDVEADAVELPSKIYLFQGLPKSDKMEMIIQKAVELGAYEIIPVVTKRVVVKLDEKRAAKKVQRWNAIAEGAAKQSGRSMVPEVHDVMTYEEALEYAQELDVRLIPYEKAIGMEMTRQAMEAILPGQSVGIFIGPEGGFEEAEVDLAQEKGTLSISLGKRILRTETAGLAVLSVLMYHLECVQETEDQGLATVHKGEFKIEQIL